MNHAQITSAVERQLKVHGVATQRRGEDTLVVSKRNAVGKTARAELELPELFQAMGAEEAPEDIGPACWIASYVEGVDRILSAHQSRLARKMSFVDAAGRLMMRLEGPGFPLGVRAAGGRPALTHPWMAGLLLSFWIEMDHFLLSLSESKFESWGCTYDRVFTAARSLLYHKTRYHEMQPHAYGSKTADMYAVGDGYDASRALILAELDFDRCYAGLWVAVPGQSRVLVQDRAGGDLEAFQAAVRSAYEAEDYPLSKRVFELTRSKFSLPA